MVESGWEGRVREWQENEGDEVTKFFSVMWRARMGRGSRIKLIVREYRFSSGFGSMSKIEGDDRLMIDGRWRIRAWLKRGGGGDVEYFIQIGGIIYSGKLNLTLAKKGRDWIIFHNVNKNDGNNLRGVEDGESDGEFSRGNFEATGRVGHERETAEDGGF
jgi:hypothetical protein